MFKQISILLVVLFISISGFANLKLGAAQTELYLPMLKGKNVALVVNQTSTIGKIHLLDTLLSLGVKVVKVFAPEHGFRGDADAGQTIYNGCDAKTGVTLVSIYGKNKKPTETQLYDVDIVIFDIQDVGARFYTYISSLHYVMEACAEQNKLLVVLDRPNPNDYVDGPLLRKKFKSFVGVDPIPVLHGCTVGELALMTNGEAWLAKGLKCPLQVIKMKGWEHAQPYSLPMKPSPNLPNDRAIQLYPSLCLFEGTEISMGRGTYSPFQVLGFPSPKFGTYSFTPQAIEGMDTKPTQNGMQCFGLDLRNDSTTKGFSLSYFIEFYKLSGLGEKFFSRPAFFDKLAGTDELRKQIIKGKSEAEIRASWQKDLIKYKQIRTRYLLYSE